MTHLTQWRNSVWAYITVFELGVTDAKQEMGFIVDRELTAFFGHDCWSAYM